MACFRVLKSIVKLGVVAQLFAGCSRSAHEEATQVIPLIVSEGDRDVGTLWAGSRTTKQVCIYNKAERTISIREFRASCGCSQVSPNSLVIPPGGLANVELTIDLTEQVQQADAEPFRFTIMPDIEGDPSHDLPVIWTFNGTVEPLLVISQRFVRFKEPIQVADNESVQTVNITCHAPVKSITPHGCESLVKTSLDREPDGNYCLTLSPRGDVPRGQRFKEQLMLATQLQNGEHVVISGPVVAGRIPGEIDASPFEIDAGFVTLGEVIHQQVVIYSPLGKRFSVVAASADGGNADVKVNSSSDEQAVLEIQYPVTVAGSCTLTLSVEASVDSKHVRRVLVPIRYYGITKEAGET